jgi:hypothetical protein
LLQVLGISALSLCGGRATRLVACGLFLGAVVASFAGVALGWRFEAALGVVVVVERVRRVVELAGLVVGEPSGAPVGRVREDGHALMLAGAWRARQVSAVGLFFGGQCGAFAFGLVDVDRGRLFCGRSRPLGAVAARIICLSAGGRLEPAERRRSPVSGVFVLALTFTLEGGRCFPVAKRAGGDAKLGGDSLPCHSLAEQLRGPLLLSGSLLAAAALVGELLLRPRPRPPGRPPNGELPN